MIAGPGGWFLAPEGAAVRPSEGVAVVADVHLGYEWARGRGGDQIPPHSLRETADKLGALHRRSPFRRLIVAGDLMESALPCPRSNRDLIELVAWLRSIEVDLTWVRGNHDPPRSPAQPRSIEVAGWTIAHGDRPAPGDLRIIGHHHPSIRVDGLSAGCFLHSPTLIVLPAFSANAAGLDLLGAPLSSPLDDGSLRCAAGLDGVILDFGPLGDLRRPMVGRGGSNGS